MQIASFGKLAPYAPPYDMNLCEMLRFMGYPQIDTIIVKECDYSEYDMAQYGDATIVLGCALPTGLRNSWDYFFVKAD